MTQSKEKIAALEAHLKHEMSLLQGDGLKQTIDQEISALFDWFDEVCINDLISQEEAWEFFRRNIIEAPVPDEIPKFLEGCMKVIHSCMQNDKTKLDGILPKEQYDKLIEKSIEMKDLRKEIFNQTVQSSIFSMIISDVLYKGIKGYVVSENVVMKKIPGASSILSAGMDLLNKTTFGIAGNIADDSLKKFVDTNIKDTLKNSEEFLNSLDDKMLKKLSDELWEIALNYSADSVSEYIASGEMESAVPIAKDILLHFRESSIFSKTGKALFEYFFKEKGYQRIATLLDEFGITKERVLKELTETVVPVLEKDIVRSYMEMRVRARLEAYYLS